MFLQVFLNILLEILHGKQGSRWFGFFIGPTIAVAVQAKGSSAIACTEAPESAGLKIVYQSS